MQQFKALILFLLFTLFFFCCKAQDTNKYVYQDSSGQITGSASTQIGTQQGTDSSADTTVNAAVQPDNILQLNTLTLSPDSIAALKNSKSFAYAKNLDSLLKALKEKNEVQKNITDNRSNWLENLLASSFTTIVLWSLAISFIAFILYKLFFTEGRFFRAPVKNEVNELNEKENIAKAHDYNKMITQSIHDKDYRLAARYLYLQSLQKLADKKLLQLETKKTNYQYINELGNTVYKDDFLWLTLNYEYVWYGEFDLNEENFMQLKNSFEQFNNRLPKN